jgi:hypothetical protein
MENFIDHQGNPLTARKRRTWLELCKTADWLKEDLDLPARARWIGKPHQADWGDILDRVMKALDP